MLLPNFLLGPRNCRPALGLRRIVFQFRRRSQAGENAFSSTTSGRESCLPRSVSVIEQAVLAVPHLRFTTSEPEVRFLHCNAAAQDCFSPSRELSFFFPM